jgi:hypothetical protein
MFTVDVVLPTPPFWFATTNTRVAFGRGSRGRYWALWRASTLCCAARANGVAMSSNSSPNAARSAAVRTLK